MAHRAAPFALALALVAGACSSDSGGSTADGGESVAAGSDSGADSGSSSGSSGSDGQTDGGSSDAATDDGPGFPSIDVIDLDTSTTVDLGQVLAGSDLPTLLWFWAPH
ncbi:MAG: hypothetical protein ACRBI6_06110 [Acidimicrobiales bacterium]